MSIGDLTPCIGYVNIVAMDRIKRMQHLRDKGLSYQQIGQLYHLSRQRVHQLISGYTLLSSSLRTKIGWYPQIKAAVLERDNNQCVKCGSAENLVLHHIDGNDKHNNIDNLVTLCSNCHLDLHRPKIGTRRRSERVNSVLEYYKKHPNVTLSSIGKVFGVTPQRIHQIVKAEKKCQ